MKFINKRFLAVRLATLTWGFLITYFFTGQLILASKIFAVIAIGNTVIMYLLVK